VVQPKEYFLFTVVSKVVFQSGAVEEIPVYVHERTESKAKRLALEYLTSEKSGYKIASVLHQHLTMSSAFIANGKDISEEYPFI
jgi:hypothetical protein